MQRDSSYQYQWKEYKCNDHNKMFTATQIGYKAYTYKELQ